MSVQPQLPVREEPRSLEYAPLGEEGDPWTVNDWRGLSATFGVGAAEMVAFHHDFSGDSRHWKIIRRIYGVMASMGDAVEEEDMESWDWKKLSSRLAVPEKLLREELDDAVVFWKKQCVSRKIRQAKTAAPEEVNSLDEIPRFNVHRDIEESAVRELLEKFRFGHVSSAADRLFVANRILEQRRLFDDKNRRESARQIIVMELNLADSEAGRALLKRRLDALLKKATDISKTEGEEVMSISTSLEKNEKAHTALSEKYFKAAADIGEDAIEEGEVRKIALGTFSHAVEAVREYYASGERLLMDGMFAADELVFLTTPLGIRPAQYRPDIVLRVNEAMKPENLWDPDYKPTVIQREVSRRLLRLAKGLTEEEEPAFIPDIDEAPGSEDDIQSDVILDVPAAEPAADAPVYSTAPPPEDDFMVIG